MLITKYFTSFRFGIRQCIAWSARKRLCKILCQSVEIVGGAFCLAIALNFAFHVFLSQLQCPLFYCARRLWVQHTLIFRSCSPRHEVLVFLCAIYLHMLLSAADSLRRMNNHGVFAVNQFIFHACNSFVQRLFSRIRDDVLLWICGECAFCKYTRMCVNVRRTYWPTLDTHFFFSFFSLDRINLNCI